MIVEQFETTWCYSNREWRHSIDITHTAHRLIYNLHLIHSQLAKSLLYNVDLHGDCNTSDLAESVLENHRRKNASTNLDNRKREQEYTFVNGKQSLACKKIE